MVQAHEEQKVDSPYVEDTQLEKEGQSANYVITGTPASGLSTLKKMLDDRLGTDYVIVETDDLIEQLMPQWFADQLWAARDKMINTIGAELQTIVKDRSKHHVILTKDPEHLVYGQHLAHVAVSPDEMLSALRAKGITPPPEYVDRISSPGTPLNSIMKGPDQPFDEYINDAFKTVMSAIQPPKDTSNHTSNTDVSTATNDLQKNAPSPEILTESEVAENTVLEHVQPPDTSSDSQAQLATTLNSSDTINTFNHTAEPGHNNPQKDVRVKILSYYSAFGYMSQDESGANLTSYADQLVATILSRNSVQPENPLTECSIQVLCSSDAALATLRFDDSDDVTYMRIPGKNLTFHGQIDLSEFKDLDFPLISLRHWPEAYTEVDSITLVNGESLSDDISRISYAEDVLRPIMAILILP